MYSQQYGNLSISTSLLLQIALGYIYDAICYDTPTHTSLFQLLCVHIHT